jgi:hypothetical protein
MLQSDLRFERARERESERARERARASEQERGKREVLLISRKQEARRP